MKWQEMLLLIGGFLFMNKNNKEGIGSGTSSGNTGQVSSKTTIRTSEPQSSQANIPVKQVQDAVKDFAGQNVSSISSSTSGQKLAVSSLDAGTYLGVKLQGKVNAIYTGNPNDKIVKNASGSVVEYFNQKGFDSKGNVNKEGTPRVTSRVKTSAGKYQYTYAGVPFKVTRNK